MSVLVVGRRLAVSLPHCSETQRFAIRFGVTSNRVQVPGPSLHQLSSTEGDRGRTLSWCFAGVMAKIGLARTLPRRSINPES